MISGKQQKKIQVRRQRRARRVQTSIRGTLRRPRLAVFRSLKHISVQLIDDVRGHTVAQAKDSEIKSNLKGLALAQAVGTLIADRAKSQQITQVVFDRRHYKYHGVVKAVADGARQAGLEL